jgi:anti-anti-sigma factor
VSLRARVKGLIVQGTTSIILDLAGVTYLDSGALGVLTGLHMGARQANCRFQLANLTPRTAKLLQTTNLTNFVDIETGQRGANFLLVPRRAARKIMPARQRYTSSKGASR